MKATVIYISKSGKSASLNVTQQLGVITTSVSGFVGIAEGQTLTKGQVIDIPATKVSVEHRTSEDGTIFNHLSFSN